MSSSSLSKLNFREMPWLAKANILFWASVFLPLFGWILLQKPLKGVNIFDFLIILVLAVVFEIKPLVILKKGGSFTISSIVQFASILLFKPATVLFFILICNLVADAIARKKPWNFFINAFQLPVLYYIAALTYNSLKASQPFYENLLVNMPAILTSVLVLISLNFSTHCFFRSSLSKEPFFQVLQSQSQGILLYEFSQYPVSVLLAMVYHFQRFALVLFFLPFVLFYFAYHFQSRLEVKEQEAIKDPLTLLYNRRFFNQVLSRLTEAKNASPFSLIIFDIDDFKKLNDTLGHLEGDQVLKTIAEISLKTVRNKDIVFRYGGEEFGIVLTETIKIQAAGIAERLRHDIEKSRKRPVTISLGIASFPVDGLTAKQLIKKADLALYKAKGQGKNQVVAA